MPPLLVPQDPLEKIQQKQVNFDEHFELEVTPPKEHKENEPHDETLPPM